jgi:hypothetical protein
MSPRALLSTRELDPAAAKLAERLLRVFVLDA